MDSWTPKKAGHWGSCSTGHSGKVSWKAGDAAANRHVTRRPGPWSSAERVRQAKGPREGTQQLPQDGHGSIFEQAGQPAHRLL